MWNGDRYYPRSYYERKRRPDGVSLIRDLIVICAVLQLFGPLLGLLMFSFGSGT